MRYDTARVAVLLCLGLLLPASCGREAEPPQRVRDSPPAAEMINLNVPVVYDTRLWAEPMTDAMKGEIISLAIPLTPEGQRIWYIHSHINRVSEGHWQCRATVHFTPHEATPRLRRGQRVLIIPGMLPGGFRKVPQETITEILKDATDAEREEYERLKARIDSPLYTWCQMSLADKPFRETLEPPDRKQLWPFGNPDGFTDEETIGIVDFIRTSPRHAVESRDNPDGTFTVHGGMSVDGGLPILGMHREKNGTIKVTTGSVQHGLAGSGQEIHLRRKGKTFEVLDVWEWVS